MWPDPQETADFVTFTEEIFNGKLHFMCSEFYSSKYYYVLKQALNFSMFCITTELNFCQETWKFNWITTPKIIGNRDALWYLIQY